jgi:hypothetical protein
MVIEDVWNKELRAALDEAMTILSKKQHEIRQCTTILD